MTVSNQKLPDATMLGLVEKIVQFMETRAIDRLFGVFAKDNVVLLDSFAPYVFSGTNAGADWASGFIAHASNIEGLRHSFGTPQEFSRDRDTAFFSQPIIWTGVVDGHQFHEAGGLALKLVLEDTRWRIQNYGWAATRFDLR